MRFTIILNSIVDVIFDKILLISVFFRFCITHIFKIFKAFDVNTCMFRNNLFLDMFAFINFVKFLTTF